MRPSTIIKQRFKSAIFRGTGEAYLLIQQYAKLDFSNAIIYASTKNCAYDGQCESSRVDYLWGLIGQSKQRDKIRAAILKALHTRQTHTWTLVQLFELTKKYADLNDDEARQAIYRNFMSDPEYRMDWPGYAEILQLDELKGLLFIAAKIGRELDRNPEAWDDDSMIRHYEQLYPEANAMEQLEAGAIGDKYIGIYLEELKKSAIRARNREQPKVVYQDAIDEALTRRILRKDLSETDLLLIAQRLIVEKNKVNREKLMSVFIKYKFPLDSAFILNLARQSPKKMLSRRALRALKFLKSDEIRQFALEGMVNTKDPGLFSAILTANYQEGDHLLLNDLVMKHHNEDLIEGLIYSYISIYQANHTTHCREPLEALYQKSNCGIHRDDLVKILIHNDVLSDQIRKELPFDCCEDVRKLAE